MQRSAHIAIAGTNKRGYSREFFLLNLAVGKQQIFLPHRARSELFRQRAIGLRSLAEHHHAARFLVEAMDDRELGPAWLAIFQPVVNAFARKWRGRVRVPARRFVDDEQMFVFEKN